MINWCPSCQTALSDLEVGPRRHAGQPVAHPLPRQRRAGRFLTVATTRPETMLGDTAVAINPKDARYLRPARQDRPTAAHGSRDPDHPRRDRRPRIRHRRRESHAGARPRTTSRPDKRHNLPKIQVIDENAENDRRRRTLRRPRPLRRPQSKSSPSSKNSGCSSKSSHTSSASARCQRCKTAVEPLISTQWFVKTKPLAEKAIAAVETREIGSFPANWSRPTTSGCTTSATGASPASSGGATAFPRGTAASATRSSVAREDPAPLLPLRLKPSQQDTDVLDTWFARGLWPFSTLGWPDQTARPRRATTRPR